MEVYLFQFTVLTRVSQWLWLRVFKCVENERKRLWKIRSSIEKAKSYYAPVIHKIRQLNCGGSLLNDIVAVKKKGKKLLNLYLRNCSCIRTSAKCFHAARHRQKAFSEKSLLTAHVAQQNICYKTRIIIAFKSCTVVIQPWCTSKWLMVREDMALMRAIFTVGGKQACLH